MVFSDDATLHRRHQVHRGTLHMVAPAITYESIALWVLGIFNENRGARFDLEMYASNVRADCSQVLWLAAMLPHIVTVAPDTVHSYDELSSPQGVVRSATMSITCFIQYGAGHADVPATPRHLGLACMAWALRQLCNSNRGITSGCGGASCGLCRCACDSFSAARMRTNRGPLPLTRQSELPKGARSVAMNTASATSTRVARSDTVARVSFKESGKDCEHEAETQ